MILSKAVIKMFGIAIKPLTVFTTNFDTAAI